MFEGYTKKYDGKKLFKYYQYDECMCKMFAPILKYTLRFRNWKSFNDPYDCYIASSLNGEVKSVKNEEMSGIYVCSLTTSFDNILMWSHYASNHMGFVVEYDAKKLKEIEYTQMEVFSYVEYSDDIKYINFLSTNNDSQIVQAAFHKAQCWNYEKEVRSTLYDGAGKDYIDININKDCIVAIYLGSYFLIKEKFNIPFFLKNWKDDKKLYYMQLKSDKYELIKKQDLKNEWFNNTFYHC